MHNDDDKSENSSLDRSLHRISRKLLTGVELDNLAMKYCERTRSIRMTITS